VLREREVSEDDEADGECPQAVQPGDATRGEPRGSAGDESFQEAPT
jgi:hypothetical protein